jgi:alkylation response protein AidB-like acyl-CoA dehydrogenase
MLGPTLIEHGTPEQQERFLPGIRSGAEIWCQGYSEPEAGSDLASLRTTAVLDGDDYVVTGQKVWTSFGQRAQWCFLLVRTGTMEERYRSISFLLVDMKSAGIEWRPIRDMSGAEDFGELFLDEVVVPAHQLVGGEGNGWRVAMSSLSHERLLASNCAHLRARVDALVDLARGTSVGTRARDEVIRLFEQVFTLERVESRVLSMARREDPRFPAWASLLKVAGTEARQAIAECATLILGVDASAASSYGAGVEAKNEASVWAHELLESRASTIYAGSSEIQRNILAERGLGLPKD